MKRILFSLAFALFAFVAQAQVQKFVLPSGDSVAIGTDRILYVFPTGSGTSGARVWYALQTGAPKDMEVSTPFAQIVAGSGGKLASYTYFKGGTATGTVAINPWNILKMSDVGSNTVVDFINGKRLTLDDPFSTVASAAAQSGVTEYATADTFDYVVPANAKSLLIEMWGAGGGGGSGRRGVTNTARSGGGGGGGGAFASATILVADLTNDSLSIIVGAGGTAGAAVTANTTNGNAGTAGGSSQVLLGSTVLLKANGGAGGAAGTALPVTAAAGGTVGDQLGVAGGTSDTTGVGGAGASSVNKVGGGGAGGAGLTSFNVAFAGGVGGSGWYGLQAGGVANTAATAISTGRYSGGGGGGGTSHASNAGGTGGAGRTAGGGGGGAASTNGANSGAGGAGGAGYVRITPIF